MLLAMFACALDDVSLEGVRGIFYATARRVEGTDEVDTIA
jgi:hypothetical protein